MSLTNKNRPAEQIPSELLTDFTMNGRVSVEYDYRDQAYSSNKPAYYRVEEIDRLIEKAKNRESFYYEDTDQCLYSALNDHAINGKQVAIIGSAQPIYEGVCLAFDGHPVSIDYQTIIAEDSRIKVLPIDEYNDGGHQFDVAFSISTFEHSGLGRYGDPLDPDGDIKAIQHLRKMIKPGGLLFLAVPLSIDKDILCWNTHRVYGKHRIKKLLSEWKVVDFYQEGNPWQPVIVLLNEPPLMNNFFQLKKLFISRFIRLKILGRLVNLKKKLLG